MGWDDFEKSKIDGKQTDKREIKWVRLSVILRKITELLVFVSALYEAIESIFLYSLYILKKNLLEGLSRLKYSI